MYCTVWVALLWLSYPHPAESITEQRQAADVSALDVVYTYHIHQAVPLNGSITYAEIAKATGLSESLVYRFIRHAMANRIFAEASPGRVTHTAVSHMMVEDPGFLDNVGMWTREVAPALSKTTEALARFPDSGEPNETAYAIANGTELDMFSFLADKPERARRFGQSMKFYTKGEACNIKHLTSSYDWAALDKPDTVLVDVGGGHGGVVQHLADTTKNMTFIVQDLPGTAQQGSELLPERYSPRIQFAGHDIFSEQTGKGKDIYFFRWIFHNHSDPYCVKMLKCLVPVMRKGTKILVFEMVLPQEPQTTLTQKLSL